MNYYLLQHDIRNKVIESKICDQYDSFINKEISVITLKNISSSAYYAYRMISRKYNPEKMDEEIARKFITSLEALHLKAYDENCAIAIEDILRILEKNNYLTLAIPRITYIYHSDSTSIAIKKVIYNCLLKIANHYLLLGKKMDARRFYHILGEKFIELNYLIISTRFFNEVTLYDQNKSYMGELLSIYNEMNEEIDNNDISKQLVLLSNQYIEIYQTIPDSEIDENYLSLCVINQSISNICLLSNVYYASKEKNRDKIFANNELINYLFSNTTNDKILTIYKLIKKDNLSGLARDIYPYIDTLEIIEDIKNRLKIKQLTGDYAYYTRIENLANMFPEKLTKKHDEKYIKDIGKLSLMHYAYMNDPKEGMPLLDYINKPKSRKSKKTNIKEDREIFYPYVFMKCFTSRKDDIPMWEMYGDSAKGCCIILNWKKMIKESNLDHLFRVCYLDGSRAYLPDGKKHKLKINREMGKLLSNLRNIYRSSKDKELFLGLLNEIRYLFKNIEYSHEEEIRFIYFNKEDTDDYKYTEGDIPRVYIVPDIKAYIKEIIIGPRLQDSSLVIPYLQKQLHEMRKYIDYDQKTKIFKSKVHYK